jgi:hypothetical protein
MHVDHTLDADGLTLAFALPELDVKFNVRVPRPETLDANTDILCIPLPAGTAATPQMVILLPVEGPGMISDTLQTRTRVLAELDHTNPEAGEALRIFLTALGLATHTDEPS